MSRLAGRSRRDDTGAYAVLYAVLVTLLCMIVAIVVDLGMLRTDRRSEKSASDNAAVAGAFYINLLDPNSPADACFNAFDYVRANLTDDGNTFVRPNCAVLNGACTPDVAGLAGSPERHATGTAGRYIVAITYPVSDNSVLMHADVAPGTGPQILDLARDGNSCQRIAVEVLGKRSFVFALVNRFKSGTTNVHSVARSEVVGTGSVVAPLVTLDPVSCTTLEVTGQGGVTVLANNDDPLNTYPGGIAVDSNGSAGSGPHDCTGGGGNRYTMDASDGPNGFIHAESTSDGKPPSIYSYALAGSFAGKSYEPSDVTACTSTTSPIPTSVDLCPKPVAIGQRITRSPWDLRYNCTVPNPTCSAPYINNLVANLGGAGAPVANGPWTELPNPAWTTGDKKKFCGETGGQTAQAFPTGNYYITCSTLSMKVNYSFGPGSTLVLAGGLSVESTGGCFALGVSAAQRDPLCAGTLAPTAVPSPADSIIYVRNKADVVRQAQASLFLFHTLVYQTGGAGDAHGIVNINSGNGALYWTAPLGAGVWGDFEDLAYWNEAAATDSNPFFIGGQAGLYLEGTMFMPNAVFEFHGDGGERQISAQFVAWRLLSSGQANLDMKPDKNRQLPVPIVGVHLIR
jgi:Flp pilus assembly protein TadG